MFRYVVCHEKIFPDRQSNVHYFISLIFCYRKFAAWQVFETYNLFKFSTKYRFVKTKRFFGIAVEINVRIDTCHIFLFCIQTYHLITKKMQYKSVKKGVICDKPLNKEIKLE